MPWLGDIGAEVQIDGRGRQVGGSQDNSVAEALFSTYVREIVGRTEQYWCPIKHARRVIGAHPQYAQFYDYGDATAFHTTLKS